MPHLLIESVLAAIIIILIVRYSRNERKLLGRLGLKKKEKKDLALWYEGKLSELRAQLERKNKRLKKPDEWRLIGVIMQGIMVPGDQRVYTIVDFNPETGELRA